MEIIKAEQLGAKLITTSLLERFEKITGHKPHIWLKRSIFFAHKDLELLLDHVEKGLDIYIYTGRGPSSGSLHLGHLLPFIFTKWLQEVFNCIVIIQVSDDEKLYNGDMTLEQIKEFGRENVKDILSIGFDVSKTHIFFNTEYIGKLYPNIITVQRHTTLNMLKTLFGSSDTDSIGKISFPAIQVVPAYSSSFPELLSGLKDPMTLVTCGLDQAPYFELARSIAYKIGSKKPVIIYSKFLPSIEGTIKMSSSVASSAIFLNDTNEVIRKKINSAFSGGKDTLEDHIKYGADINTDIPYKWLEFLMPDDDLLHTIKHLYSEQLLIGETRIKSSEIKKILSDIIIELFAKFRKNRT